MTLSRATSTRSYRHIDIARLALGFALAGVLAGAPSNAAAQASSPEQLRLFLENETSGVAGRV